MRRSSQRSYFAAPTGTRYHGSASCNGLNSYDMSHLGTRGVPTVSRSEIEARSLSPCGICKPAPTLRVVGALA